MTHSQASRKTMIAETLEPRVLMSTYDAAKDFSTTANPSGPWTYGVRFTEFADFAPFVAVTPLDFSPNATGWSENSGSPPYVGINTTKAEVDSEGVNLPTGVLVMHPGGNGEYADLRFTVPEAGDVTANFTFEGIDTNNTTTDVHVLYNNASVFDGSINEYREGANVVPALTIPNAVQGGIVDFIVGTGSNGNYFNDATSLTARITTGVANDHLVFTHQPKDGLVGTPVPTQVKVVDSHGRIDKSVPDGVSLQLNVPTGSTATKDNAPFVFVRFVNGVATFAGLQSPFIDVPGTYTLTAVANAGPDQQFGTPGVNSAISKPFKIAGMHLVFNKQPTRGDVASPLPFSVGLKDGKNKDAPNEGIVSLQLVDATTNTVVASGQYDLTGVPYNNLTTDDIPLMTLVPGTYFVNATQNTAGNTVAGASSSLFKVTPDHVVFIRQPSRVAVYHPIPFRVALETAKNKPVLLSEYEMLKVDFTLGSEAADMEVSEDPIVHFSGVYDNATDSAGMIGLKAPGTYQLTAEILDINDTKNDAIFIPGVSKRFVVTA